MFRFVQLLLLLAPALSFSQTAPETWDAVSFKNIRTNEQESYSCIFKVYPGDRIDWIQGVHVQSFPVTSTEGALPMTGSGSIIYHLEKEGKYGKVIIERLDEEIFLTIDLTKDLDLGAHYQFKVINP